MVGTFYDWISTTVTVCMTFIWGELDCLFSHDRKVKRLCVGPVNDTLKLHKIPCNVLKIPAKHHRALSVIFSLFLSSLLYRFFSWEFRLCRRLILNDISLPSSKRNPHFMAVSVSSFSFLLRYMRRSRDFRTAHFSIVFLLRKGEKRAITYSQFSSDFCSTITHKAGKARGRKDDT